jgi:hypothetical protein
MKTSVRIIYWLPRIISIVAILFISIFSLDAFSPDLTIWQQIGGFLVHLIPCYILTGMLIIAWKWEYVGGIIYIIAGLVFSVSVFLLNYNRNHFSASQSLLITLTIAFPFVIAGILFIVSHFRKHEFMGTEK